MSANLCEGQQLPPQRPVTLGEALQRLEKIAADTGDRFTGDIRDMGFDEEVRVPWRP